MLHSRTARTVAALATLALFTAGCAAGGADTAAQSPGAGSPSATSPSATASTAPDQRQSSSGASHQVTKILTFVVENKSMNQELSHMPAVKALADTYGYAADFSAIQHPSLPNYLAMAGGQTYGVNDDEPPATHPISGPSVFGRALDRGRTAKLYAESMPSSCTLTSTGRYAVKHNPWAYFVDERDACNRLDVPFDAFAADVASGSLPNLGMAIPDLCSDAHDCPLTVTNAWLSDRMGEIMAGPDWKSGHLAVVITADEDDKKHGNKILTVVAHPSLHHVVASTPMTHYSLSRAYAEVAGVGPLNEAAGAASLLDAFGLQPA